MKTLNVGDVVVYHDPRGNPHNALVTAVWTEDMCNVVFTSTDENMQDQYGRQITRETSVMCAKKSGVHGRYWRRSDEPANEYIAPKAV